MNVSVRIEGVSPLLMNRFHEAAQEAVSNQAKATHRGDKGSPREQAEPKLYTDSNGRPILPGPNIFAAIVSAGRFIKSGRRTLTTNKESLVPAGLALSELECPITPVKWEVDSRAVVVPATGGRIMAHRPRFDAWRLGFTLEIDESLFSVDTVRELVDLAGQRIGIGDFRPARRGPFGRFKVIKWQ